MNVSTSLRSEAAEIAYQLARLNNDTLPLSEETRTRGFVYWAVIVNRFPYDAVFSVHDMLIPKRVFSNCSDMTEEERIELESIIAELSEDYDLMFENFPGKRSVKNHYHIHLATYKQRSEMSI